MGVTKDSDFTIISNRWENLGLLEDLNPEQKLIISIGFENLSDYLLCSSSDNIINGFYKNNSFLHTIIFPTLCRLYRECGILFETKKLLDKTHNFYMKGDYDMIIEGVNQEARFIVNFIEQYK